MSDILKLTEDETIILLMTHLTKTGWNVDSYCLGQTRGCDIIASQNSLKLFIEVKGDHGYSTFLGIKARYCG